MRVPFQVVAAPGPTQEPDLEPTLGPADGPLGLVGESTSYPRNLGRTFAYPRGLAALSNLGTKKGKKGKKGKQHLTPLQKRLLYVFDTYPAETALYTLDAVAEYLIPPSARSAHPPLYRHPADMVLRDAAVLAEADAPFEDPRDANGIVGRR